MSGLESFAAGYREEVAERLMELETTLLDLEATPEDGELIARAFRALHTIKGSGAMFGFEAVAAFTHEIETVFDAVRNKRLPVTSELIDIALKSKDAIRSLVEEPESNLSAVCDPLVAALRAMMEKASPDGGEAPTAPPVATPPPIPPRHPHTYRIQFAPNAGLFADGTNVMGLFDELRQMGECSLVAHTQNLPPLDELDPENCLLTWDIFLTTEQPPEAIRDVFIFVEDRVTLTVDRIDDGNLPAADLEVKRLGEILIDRGALTMDQLREALGKQKRLGELLTDKGVAPDVVQAAVVEQTAVREARAKREHQEAQTSIRVAAEKLDWLVDLVGELVIAQARLTQIASKRDDAELLNIAEDIERLSSDLRDSTLNIRMVPIGTTFSRFTRLVRDLSGELGKRIDLITDGAETELDKTVIERLGDPLVHLIRNSCDHGVETPDVREQKGKPAKGTVKLSAYHSGPNVFIEIHDDGAGLDAAGIRAKAIERGLIESDAKLSEKELFGLIFLPGFSTAKTVSNVSGRGVGMDVVKRSIEALRGTVEIESRPDEGTTIRLKLPLTLAIIEGLLVAVGRTHYVLPMALVEECVELTTTDVEMSHGNKLAIVRGERVPYLRLRECFGEMGERPPIEQITIVSAEGLRFGFVVDEVVGEHQTVIRTLGKMYRDMKGISGATILGDGTVALIIDVPTLMHITTAKAS